MLHWFSITFGHYAHFISHLGFFGMFFSVMIENLGIPLPTAPAYLVGQVMLDKGTASFFQVYLVLYLGHTSGSLLSYWAGRRIAASMKAREGFTDTQHRIADWFESYGVLTVLATRLIGYVRPWGSYIAGIAEVKFWPFFILSSIGTLVINAVCLAFTKQFLFLWEGYAAARVLITLSCTVGIVFVIYELLKKRQVRPAVHEELP